MFTEIAKVQQRRYCIQNSQQRRCGVQFLDYIFVPNKMLIYSNVYGNRKSTATSILHTK